MNKFEKCNLAHQIYAIAHSNDTCNGMEAILKREAAWASLQVSPKDTKVFPEYNIFVLHKKTKK